MWQWIISLICVGTAVCDIILGWDEASSDLPSVPWQKGGANEQPANAVVEPSDVHNV